MDPTWQHQGDAVLSAARVAPDGTSQLITVGPERSLELLEDRFTLATGWLPSQAAPAPDLRSVSGMATGYVRPARETDAERIAEIQLATWRTAYPRFIPRFAIDAVPARLVTERWQDAVRHPPSERHRVLVAIEQAADRSETLVGFTAVGPADDTWLVPGESTPESELAAITDLLVEPRWGRRGHGSRLLAAAVDLWRADGFTSAVAWAFQEDVATRKFLASAGWQPDGATRALDLDGIIVPQLRWHVALAPGLSADRA